MKFIIVSIFMNFSITSARIVESDSAMFTGKGKVQVQGCRPVFIDKLGRGVCRISGVFCAPTYFYCSRGTASEMLSFDKFCSPFMAARIASVITNNY